MNLLDLFSPDAAGTGLLSPQDHLMALFAGLSKAGAAMSQPGLSRGAQVAQGLGALGPGMQEAQQAALMQGLLGQKLQESTDKTKARKMFADVFSEPGSMTPPTPINVAQPGQSTAQAMQQRLNTGNAGAFNDKLQDPRLMQAMALDSSLAPTITALRTANAPIKFNAGEGFMTPNGQIIRQPGGQTDLAKLLSDRDALPAGDPRRDLYDAEIVKRQTEGGFRFGPNGMQPLQGGPADLGYMYKKAAAEAGGKAPVEAWLKWQGPQQQQPGANILDLSGVGPARPGAMPGGPPMLPGAPGAPGAGPRTVVKAPQEWSTDPNDPRVQVSGFTGERKAMPGGTTDEKESAKSAILSTDRAIATAEELLKHPGREAGTGKSYLLSYVPGTDAYDFGAKLETLKAQVWLPEVEKMKGMGALSNAEGAKLTSAFQSLDPKMTEEGFTKSLNDAVSQLKAARDRFMSKAQTGYLPQPSALPPSPAPPASAPKPSGGMRFLGFE